VARVANEAYRADDTETSAPLSIVQ
jgi:hypothetical protein